jgi:hypothetical protein
MVNVSSGNIKKSVSPQAKLAQKFIIAGLCMIPVGFVIMVFNLMKIYNYAGLSCDGESSCTRLIDRLSFGIHAGITIIVLGIASALLGTVAYFYFRTHKK